MARPSIYTPALAAEICKRLAAGESLLKICEDPDSVFPSRQCIYEWVIDNREGFGDEYARARNIGLDVLAEQLLAIGGEAKPGVITVDKYDKLGRPITETTTKDTVDRDRLHVDTLKWYLSKLAPKRYGDKLQVEHSGNVSIEDRLRAGRARVAGSE